MFRDSPSLFFVFILGKLPENAPFYAAVSKLSSHQACLGSLQKSSSPVILTWCVGRAGSQPQMTGENIRVANMGVGSSDFLCLCA